MQPNSPLTKKNMAEAYLHTDPSSSEESHMELLLRGFYKYVHQMEAEKQHLQQRCEQYEAEQQALPSESIIADGKQKELTAIFNVIYKAGYIVGITEKEFFERIANALSCPSFANYSQNLYNFKTTYKYDDVFDQLLKVAKQEKIG